MVSKELLDPVVDIVRQTKLSVLFKHSTLTHAVEGLGKIQDIDNDKWIGCEKACDGVQNMDY